uniref:Si:ch211-106g8.56 n=1 Tax=Sinocyclocheilus grahami TaxID=75366 RepID=A0A672PZX2_SINGR
MLSSSLIVFPDTVLANAITSRSTKQHVLEGGKVTISCNYSGSNINSLQWYRQSSKTAPEFILQAFERSGLQQKDRYVAKVQINEKQLILEISKTEMADAVIYYCALVKLASIHLSV